MISKLWRERLGYTALSLFVGWHTISIILAPLPDKNPIVSAFRAIYQPYLTAFGLDTTWDFFSPIGIGHQFSYVIEDSEGNQHSFMPILDVNWLTPDRRWYERIFTSLMNNPETYGEYFAAYYCRKHASLKPASIRLFENVEARYWPDDHLRGRKPDDPAYFTLNPLMHVECLQQ